MRSFSSPALNSLPYFIDRRSPFLLTHPVLNGCHYLVCYVLDPDKEGDREIRIRKLLFPGHRPESVLKVIVLNTAVSLDLPVTAMMVSEKKSL